jgi:hypothetical protein
MKKNYLEKKSFVVRIINLLDLTAIILSTANEKEKKPSLSTSNTYRHYFFRCEKLVLNLKENSSKKILFNVLRNNFPNKIFFKKEIK